MMIRSDGEAVDAIEIPLGALSPLVTDRTRTARRWRGGLLAALVLFVATGPAIFASSARADDTIRRPGDHPHYFVELEPHGLFGWDNLYGGDGFGLGLRASIVVVQNGFVPTINNSVAVSFGLDWLHYSDCFFAYKDTSYGCGANYFDFPVAMQWNFYVARRWSVFGEPGLNIYHGVFETNYCNGAGLPPCRYPTATGVEPAAWVGARFHFSNKIALTMRLGYPTLSVGVSFMP